MQKQFCIVTMILAVHGGLLAWGGYSHSVTWDEGAHLPAGLSHWTSGQFDLYRVNPPLVRMVAAIPVFAMHPRFEWRRESLPPTANIDRDASQKFIRANADQLQLLYAIARWACIPFSILGGLICWLWSRHLWGATAGIVSLLLWCVCPNVLGHGQLITPDVGASALGVAASYCFWRWLRAPSMRAAILSGVVLGMAELTKTTWVILFVLWPVLAGFWWIFRPSVVPHRRQAIQLVAILSLALYILNLGYLFEGTFTKLGDFEFHSRALGSISREANLGNRFSNSFLGELPVPLPKNFVKGIDRQKSNFDRRQLSYLRGQWRDHGWYHYYVYAMLIKVPLGTGVIGLLAVAVSICTRRIGDRSPRSQISDEATHGSDVSWHDEIIVLAPAICILALVSLETGFNRHLRYVLPAFPFLFVWVGKAARDLRPVDLRDFWKKLVKKPSADESIDPGTRWRSVRIIVLTIALAWATASSLYVYPHSLSYFNESIGGPVHGYLHLSSSNVDWGQDLWYLRSWYENHTEARPLYLNYRLPFVSPSIAGIESQPIPSGPVMNREGAPSSANWPWQEVSPSVTRSPSAEPESPARRRGPIPGWYVISVVAIHSPEGIYELFQEFKPVGTIGYSMNIYHISLDQANQARRMFKLPPLIDEERPRL